MPDYLAGHSAGVAELASTAGQRCGLASPEVTALRRAAFVHDVGRVAIPIPIWHKAGPLTAGEWERVRLHPYYSGRVLSRSPLLAGLGPIPTASQERLDGSATTAAFQPRPSRRPREYWRPPMPATP